VWTTVRSAYPADLAHALELMRNQTAVYGQ
jgi:hypothetical protein